MSGWNPLNWGAAVRNRCKASTLPERMVGFQNRLDRVLTCCHICSRRAGAMATGGSQ